MADKANITKKDIVEDIAARTGLTQVETKTIIECFLDSLVKGLIQGNNVEIRGFGRFKLKERKERTARNPRTGETVTVVAGTKPVFEASRELINSLNKVIVSTETEEVEIEKALVETNG